MIEDWDDYRFFLRIAEHGTLKSTAAALKVNLSTVLRRINLLEKKMGARLFDRSHDGFTLTPAGNIMKEHAKAMQHSVIELMRKVKDTDHQFGGVIKLPEETSKELWILTHPDLRNINRIRKFMEFVRKYC